MADQLIDLHAHILPGLDDGPANLSESLELLKAMRAQGIATAVAAAHAFDGRHNAAAADILARTDAVQSAVNSANLGMTIIPSMEVHLGFDTARAAETGEALCIGATPYLLVELPPNEVPHYTERALFELLLAGYRPIINHPERNRAFQRHPRMLAHFVDAGSLVLLTGASLLGAFGPEARQSAESLLRAGVASLIATDAHDVHVRTPVLRDALQAARQHGKQDQTAEIELLSTVRPARQPPTV